MSGSRSDCTCGAGIEGRNPAPAPAALRGTAARRKGRDFQAEIARQLEADGWHVQNTGPGVSGCDLIARRNGATLYIDCKRQERLKLPEWWDQTVANCPTGAVPVMAVKQSHRPVMWISQAPPR